MGKKKKQKQVLPAGVDPSEIGYPLLLLPPELIQRITSHLPYSSRCKLTLTCRKLNSIVPGASGLTLRLSVVPGGRIGRGSPSDLIRCIQKWGKSITRLHFTTVYSNLDKAQTHSEYKDAVVNHVSMLKTVQDFRFHIEGETNARSTDTFLVFTALISALAPTLKSVSLDFPKSHCHDRSSRFVFVAFEACCNMTRLELKNCKIPAFFKNSELNKNITDFHYNYGERIHDRNFKVFLSLMPNVQTLVVNFEFTDDETDPDNDFTYCPEFLKTCRALKRFEFSARGGNEDHNVDFSLMKYCRDLEHLKVSVDVSITNIPPLPRLKSATLSACSADVMLTSPELTRLDCKLNKGPFPRVRTARLESVCVGARVILDDDDEDGFDEAAVDRYDPGNMAFLERSRNTLTHVVFSFVNWPGHVMRKLGALESLSLGHIDFPGHSVLDLSQYPHLERLHMQTCRDVHSLGPVPAGGLPNMRRVYICLCPQLEDMKALRGCEGRCHFTLCANGEEDLNGLLG